MARFGIGFKKTNFSTMSDYIGKKSTTSKKVFPRGFFDFFPNASKNFDRPNKKRGFRWTLK